MRHPATRKPRLRRACRGAPLPSSPKSFARRTLSPCRCAVKKPGPAGSCPTVALNAVFSHCSPATHRINAHPRHRSGPGRLHQSICQSSDHSGGTVFGPTLVQHVFILASYVRGSPRVCYPRNTQNPGGDHTNLWRDGFFVTRVTRQSLVTANLVTLVVVRRNSMVFFRPPSL